MNLRRRGTPRDPGTAALDTTAALRFLAATGAPAARLWVDDRAAEHPSPDRERAAAWATGLAVVRVATGAARDAAIATAAAAGVEAVTAPPAGGPPTGGPDGARFAARFDLGLWPDEWVEVVFGPGALRGLAERLVAFDALLAADPAPRRLVLAGLAEHGPRLSPDLVTAIVHPQVLVELRPSGPEILAMLRQVADVVSGEPAGA